MEVDIIAYHAETMLGLPILHTRRRTLCMVWLLLGIIILIILQYFMIQRSRYQIINQSWKFEDIFHYVVRGVCENTNFGEHGYRLRKGSEICCLGVQLSGV